jgi:hypothetical protein
VGAEQWEQPTDSSNLTVSPHVASFACRRAHYIHTSLYSPPLAFLAHVDAMTDVTAAEAAPGKAGDAWNEGTYAANGTAHATEGAEPTTAAGMPLITHSAAASWPAQLHRTC